MPASPDDRVDRRRLHRLLIRSKRLRPSGAVGPAPPRGPSEPLVCRCPPLRPNGGGRRLSLLLAGSLRRRSARLGCTQLGQLRLQRLDSGHQGLQLCTAGPAPAASTIRGAIPSARSRETIGLRSRLRSRISGVLGRRPPDGTTPIPPGTPDAQGPSARRPARPTRRC